MSWSDTPANPPCRPNWTSTALAADEGEAADGEGSSEGAGAVGVPDSGGPDGAACDREPGPHADSARASVASRSPTVIRRIPHSPPIRSTRADAPWAPYSLPTWA